MAYIYKWELNHLLSKDLGWNLAPLVLAMRPWGSYLTFLIFNFLFDKMGLITHMFFQGGPHSNMKSYV